MKVDETSAARAGAGRARRASGARPLGMPKRVATPAAISSSSAAHENPATSRPMASSRLPRVSATVT